MQHSALYIGALMISFYGCIACSTIKTPEISEKIIAMEKTALNRWGAGDVHGFLDIYADEITYFDTATERRINGFAEMRQRLEPLQGKICIDHYEMIRPHVQVHGNTAVLTYNLIDHVPSDEGGLKEIRWNSTAVYAQINRQWKLIHSHWSHIRPLYQDIDPDQPM